MTTAEPLPYTDDVESIPFDEAEDIRATLDAMRELMQRHYEKTGVRTRAVHVKSHGCAVGTFEVLPGLPSELAQGAFARETSWGAFARFSNAAGLPQADALPDARGLAIKLTSNDTTCQDFVMVNHPVFLAANVKEFLRLQRILARNEDQPLTTAAKLLTGGESNPLSWHWRQAATALANAAHLPTNPAAQTYFSMAPICFGRYVAKYRVVPRGTYDSLAETIPQLADDANALGTLLARALTERELQFEFQVQLRTNAATMPIEDASVEWPESESPYRTVAVLRLPRQDIATEDSRAFGERLAFNVWNALPEHRPLGGIHRLRREAYPTSVAWRTGNRE